MSDTFKWCLDKTRLAIYDKQAFTINEYGDKEWWLNGKLHRLDGPAIERADGSKRWYLNGKWHRVNGPAVECSNGDKEWWLNDKRHRENGPAVEYADGNKYWYLNGEWYSKSDYWKELKK